MKNKILAMLLSFTLIFTTTGFSFAEEGVDNAAPEPEKKSEQVVEKKAEPVVEKKEVKEVVVKEEAPKVEATLEAEKIEAPKTDELQKVELDKAPPKEVGPPEQATHEVEQMEMEVSDKPHKAEVLKFHTDIGNAPMDYILAKGKSVAVSSLMPTNIPNDKEFTGWQEKPGKFYAVGDSIKYESSHGNNAPRTRHFYAEFKNVTPEPEPISLEIHIKGNVDTRVYNGQEQTLGGFEVVSELPEGVDVKWGHLSMYAAKGTNVGKYYMTLSENKFILTGENAKNYEPTFILDRQGCLEITPATLRIHDAEKFYGADDPEFTADWDGPAKIQWTYSREPGEDVGEYVITAKIKGSDEFEPIAVDVKENVAKKKANKNYVVENGILRIYPRTVWVDIYDFSKVYGDEDPDFGTAKVTSDDSDGFKVPYPELKYAVGRVVKGEDAKVYENALTLVDYKGEEIEVMTLNNQNPNYVFKINKGDFEITPKVIEGVLTIHDKTKVYGEEDPEFTYTWDSEFKIPKPELFREPGEDVGKYTIKAMINGQVYNEEPTIKPVKKIDAETKVSIADKVEKVQSNYDYRIKVIDGTLEITPREITIAAVYKFKMLKDITDDEEFDATVTGVLPQDEEWFEDNVYWDVDCDYEEAVGDYPIIVEVELWDDEDEWIIIDWEDYAWEDYPQEMKKVEDVPMMAAKSVGLKKNTTLEAGNYVIKTVDNVFQIRDKEEPPVDPDDPVVGPTDNGDNTPGLGDNDSTVMKAKKSNAVQTGDADACWALLNLLLMITSCLLAFLVVLSRVLRRDEEYVDEPKSFFNNWFESIMSGVVAVFTAIVFFLTENMNTPMVWTDRWTVMMIVLFVLQLAVVAYVKFRDKTFEEDN